MSSPPTCAAATRPTTPSEQLNRPNVDAKVNGRIDVTRDTRIDLEGHYLIGTDNPGSPNIQAGLAKLPIFTTSAAPAGLGQRFNRFDICRLKGGAERTVYQNSHFNDGQSSSNEDRNFNRFSTTGAASYELSPACRPFIDGGRQPRHDLGVDAGGDNRNSQGISGKFGTTFELTQKLTGEAPSGRSPPLRGSALPSYRRRDLIDASLIWTRERAHHLQLYRGDERRRDRRSPASRACSRASIRGQVDHAFRRWLIGTLRFMRGTDVYVGSPRDDIRYGAAAQLSYMLTRDWWARAEYRNEWRETQPARPGLSANVYLVGLRWQR